MSGVLPLKDIKNIISDIKTDFVENHKLKVYYLEQAKDGLDGDILSLQNDEIDRNSSESKISKLLNKNILKIEYINENNEITDEAYTDPRDLAKLLEKSEKNTNSIPDFDSLMDNILENNSNKPIGIDNEALSLLDERGMNIDFIIKVSKMFSDEMETLVLDNLERIMDYTILMKAILNNGITSIELILRKGNEILIDSVVSEVDNDIKIIMEIMKIKEALKSGLNK